MAKQHETNVYETERPLSGLGSAVLLLPVLSAVSIGLWVTSPSHTEAPPAQTTRADEELRTAVWTAQVPLADGSRVDVRLSRLQYDEQRQAFDREALARRFGLGTGEAWRCEVARIGRVETSNRATDAAASGGRTDQITAVVTAAAPCVVDRDGPAARTLEFTAGAAADPLLVLFRPPDGAIEPGTTLQFVQWGRCPGPGAELLGLALNGTPMVIALSESDEGGARLPASVARKAPTSEEE